jgi:hypothetical protein
MNKIHLVFLLIVLVELSSTQLSQPQLLPKNVMHDAKLYKKMFLTFLPFFQYRLKNNKVSSNDVKMLAYLLEANKELEALDKINNRPVYWYSRQGR